MNFWLPGKAYNCGRCGKHTYKHVFPYVSWPILTAVLGAVGILIVI